MDIQTLKTPSANAWLDLDKLEYVKCNLCGTNKTEILCRMSRFQIPMDSVICKNCGLLYLNPRMSKQQYSIFYKDVYRKFVRTPHTIEEIFEDEKKWGTESADFCSPYLKTGFYVAEIGCGPAGTLAYFQSQGMSVKGVEPSEKESAFARSQGIPVISKMLEDVSSDEINADLIILSRSLNHFADPLSALLKIRDLLKPEGMILLRLLDFPAQCHFGLLQECAQADHLYMFSPETAQAILRKAGFQIIKMQDNENVIGGWRPLFYPPKYHMKILVRKSSSVEIFTSYPDWNMIKSRILRGQRFFKIRRLRFLSTWRHFAAVSVRSIFGEAFFKALKEFLFSFSKRPA